MKKSVMNLLTIVLAICLCFVFSGNALAYSGESEYIDAETALKLYTELFSKYYPSQSIVEIDTSKYVPVEANKFYKDLNALEEELKVSVLPENNFEIEYDENGRIISLAYTDYAKQYAQEYIDALNKQLEEDSTLLNSDVPSVSTKSIKTVWDGYDKVITTIPWNPTCTVGYIAKFYASSDSYYHFTQKATNFQEEHMYSGLGELDDVWISGSPVQSLIDGRRTNTVTIRIGYTAHYTANGMTYSYSNYTNIYHEHYASAYWN